MNNLWDFILSLFNTPLAELTFWQILLALVLTGAAGVLAFFLVKVLWIVLKGIGRGLRAIFSAKHKCRKIQCPTCGRTLDKCQCEKNKKRGYLSRLYHYKKDRLNSRKK